MLDSLGSTSWHNRHASVFVALDVILRREGPANPTVMIIGPGGVTLVTERLLNDSVRKAGRARKLIGDAARYGDQVLRRLPFMPLASLEPLEVERTLTVPHRLVVVDVSARVLRAVQRDVPKAICHCVDIGITPLPERADVVIAFNVVCRLTNPAKGMTHVADAVKAGGWLLMDDRSAAAQLRIEMGFRDDGAKIHRKIGQAGQ